MATILIIDDNATERDAVQRALQKAGYSVLSASDGTTGVEVARKERPDLILCDVDMPGLTGFETMNRLQGDARTKSIPLVFITGSVDAMAGKLGRKLGAEEFIEKPFSFSKLLAAVGSSLRKNDVS
jgi:CheY-like chemotaxis protein